METFSALLALCDRWPVTCGFPWKASDAELSYFHWSTPEQTVEKTIETPAIWDAIALIMTSLLSIKPKRVIVYNMYILLDYSLTLIWNKIIIFAFQISSGFFLKNPISNKSALVWLMAWCRTGDNLWTKFTDTYMCSQWISLSTLTHWGRDNMAAISQTTLSNASSRMKMNEFRQGFHWSVFLSFESTIFQHWFR